MSTPEDHANPIASDYSQRFLFEQADIRGESAQLGSSYREILAIHQYPVGVARLLGEFLAAAVLLSSNLKFDGKLILQVRSEGQIPLLMAECDHKLQVRGIARGAEQATADSNDLLLHNGQLVITIDPTNGKRYQGVVSLLEDSLARSLDSYFEQSEQLKTRIWLAADGQQAGGLLLQQLPAQLSPDEDQRLHTWEHTCALAETVKDAELTSLPSEQLLYRLYHDEPVRLFDENKVQFQCSCSRERTRNALSTLPAADILELLEENGSIPMACEFCSHEYIFTRDDLAEFLVGDLSKTLH